MDLKTMVNISVIRIQISFLIERKRFMIVALLHSNDRVDLNRFQPTDILNIQLIHAVQIENKIWRKPLQGTNTIVFYIQQDKNEKKKI